MGVGRWLLLCVAVLWSAPAWANNTLRVVATLPDLAHWAREIGGERVEVKSLLQGSEDPHTYEPTVSDVKSLAGARVLLRVGLGLEQWLDGLIENARNSELLLIDTTEGIELLHDAGEEAHHEPAHDHPEDAHEHREGNPHVWLDPGNAALMCGRIARGLEAADPAGGVTYQQRARAYGERLQEVADRLRGEVAELSDRRFVSYHPAWPYFARAFGFEIADVITPIPGQEPSARGLVRLIEKIRRENIRVVVTEPQLPSELPELLAQETGVRVVTLSPILGMGGAESYVEQVETNVRLLVRALQDPAQ